jgi:hypothetical protein
MRRHALERFEAVGGAYSLDGAYPAGVSEGELYTRRFYDDYEAAALAERGADGRFRSVQVGAEALDARDGDHPPFEVPGGGACAGGR